MLTPACVAGVPTAWVVDDTAYRGDELRRWPEGQGRRYALAVPCTHGVWTAGGRVDPAGVLSGAGSA